MAVAGLQELAEAFARAATRPRRTLVFAAVSRGAPGEFSGANVLAAKKGERVVLTVDLDIRDVAIEHTVGVAGLEEVDLDQPVQWTAELHPELRLTPRSGGSVFDPSSDHVAFSRAGIPSISFGGTSTTTTLAHPTAVPSAETVRVLQLVFYTVQGAANAVVPPRWNELGRRRLRGHYAGLEP